MKLFLLLVVATLPAVSQIKHGSVGVVYFTDDKIIVAADSRVTRGSIQANDECKVAAIDGQIVFVSTGATGFDSHSPLIPSWTNIDVARAAYDRIVQQYSTSQGHLADIANDFANILQSEWSTAAQYERGTVISAVSQNGLTVAMMGGRDAVGKLNLTQILITYSSAGSIFASIGRSVDAVPSCPLKNYCVIGEVAVPIEFLSGVSDRAKTEARTWQPSNTVAPKDIDIARTVRQVELTSLYNEKNDVGGPVDAVELDATGSARWYQRKDNCPDN